MEDFLTQLLGGDVVTKIVLWVGILVTVATAVCAALPSLHDNKFFNILLKVLNIIAGNVGKNKNHDAVK